MKHFDFRDFSIEKLIEKKTLIKFEHWSCVAGV